MKALRIFFIILLTVVTLSFPLRGTELEEVAVLEIPEDCEVVRETIGKTGPLDSYLEAYLQGVMDTKYPDSGCDVTVRNGGIMLRGLPSDDSKSQEIIQFVRSLTKKSVHEPIIASKSIQEKQGWHGVWLPQSTILYPTQIANPRQIMFSAGGRWSDRVGGKFASAVTFGDQFPLYRWAGLWGGDLQLEVEAGVFAVFDLHDRLFPLINADYYGGIPLTFAKGPWSYRLRVYHISSHLGDEYMQAHKHSERKNKSFEAADFSMDYRVNNFLRLYGVLGSVFASDKEMKMKPMYVEYGFEARGPRTDFKQLFGQPFFAVHARNQQDVNYALDTTYALGYEWGKVHGIGRKVRLFAEYHHGFSPEGQFSRVRNQYFGLRLAYGF